MNPQAAQQAHSTGFRLAYDSGVDDTSVKMSRLMRSNCVGFQNAPMHRQRPRRRSLFSSAWFKLHVFMPAKPLSARSLPPKMHSINRPEVSTLIALDQGPITGRKSYGDARHARGRWQRSELRTSDGGENNHRSARDPIGGGARAGSARHLRHCRPPFQRVEPSLSGR